MALKYKPIARPPPPPPPPRPKPRLAPVLIGGGLLYVSAMYVSMVVFKSKRNVDNPTEITQDVVPGTFDTTAVWNRLAKKYDSDISWDEFVMGIGLLRRWTIGKAKGDVLEVSTGTGRNFDYYKPDKISSATFTDRHESMLNEAQHKFDTYRDKFRAAFFETCEVDSLPPQKKYDTVVDTFGLCSCKDPAEALVSMAGSLKSGESRILLLEHGRSHYDWLNRLLDMNVDKHVQQWGCWWNRDMMAILEDEKVKAKLEVESVSRWHLGTSYCLVLKPVSKNADNHAS